MAKKTAALIDHTFLGHPKGVFLVSGVELWERFSYYGMLGLLVLFLTADTVTGGFNWPTTMALKLMGIYTGFVFASPAIGGWIANRYLGERKTILSGGLLVLLGHILLGGPVYLPALVDTLSGQDISRYLHSDGLSFSTLFADSGDITAAFTERTLPTDSTTWLLLGYHLKLWSFLAGLLLIILGTGLIKPAVSSIINHFYPEGGERRQAGFTLFMVSIYIGSFTANFVAGTLGEKVGWHAGFTVAAIGMAFGVTAYLLGQHKWLGDIGKEVQNKQQSNSVKQPLSVADKKQIGLILLMGFFTVIYAVAFYQKGGLLNLYAQNQINRTLFNFEVPATWFLSISTGTFILFAPLVTHLVSAKFPSMEAVQKLITGLTLIASGYILLFLGDSFFKTTDTQVSAIWLILTYILFGLGDVFVWPAQIAAAAALAPKHLTSFIVGAWYLTIGLGSWLTGYVGSLSVHFSHSTTFLILFVGCMAAALVLFFIRRPAIKLAGEIKLN